MLLNLKHSSAEDLGQKVKRREGLSLLKVIPLVLETDFAEWTVNAFLAIGDTLTLIDTGKLR